MGPSDFCFVIRDWCCITNETDSCLLTTINQYITGGNANTVMVFSEDDFQFTKGKPSVFARKDLETPVKRFFCDKCGTGFGSISPSRPGSFIVKVGTLDTPEVFSPDFAIFTCDIKDYHHIPEHLTSFDKRPPKKN